MININEKFPHLDKAPIVEAVIDLQVVSLASWNEKNLKERIKEKLSHYSKMEDIREIVFEVGGSNSKKDLGCIGYRIISSDGFYIAQFTKMGFTLGRVKKYEDWSVFCEEAEKIWNIYREILAPSNIKRIGVRYINRMSANFEKKDFLKFFTDAPKKKQITNWELENFLHKDVLRVPETDYYVNLIKTIISAPKDKEVSAVLDCDAFYNGQISCDWNEIKKHLAVLHWAKNKVFFKSLNRKKIEEYK
jgi:uncharacterized protein (TIGR04255 family)